MMPPWTLQLAETTGGWTGGDPINLSTCQEMLSRGAAHEGVPTHLDDMDENLSAQWKQYLATSCDPTVLKVSERACVVCPKCREHCRGHLVSITTVSPSSIVNIS